MPKIADPMLAEFQQEAAITRRVLERVPGDKLTWKPHPKSMTLGQLAIHLATIPAAIPRIAALDSFDVVNANFTPPQPAAIEEVMTTFDASAQTAAEYLSGLTDETALAPWRMEAQGQPIATMPRVAMLRSILLNHWYHHRGQMSVYLRLLEVPVPIIYGRSADESPL